MADPGCLSRIRLFLHPGSRIRTVSIPDPGSSSKNLNILTPKKAKKWFLSSKKYDLGCSSRIPDPDADFLPSRIPDPEVKKAPNPGSRIRIRNTAFMIDHSNLTRLFLLVRKHNFCTENQLLFTSSCSPNLFKCFFSVLGIHDILRWIRIRIRGSMPLTNGSGFGFGSCYFRH